MSMVEYGEVRSVCVKDCGQGRPYTLVLSHRNHHHRDGYRTFRKESKAADWGWGEQHVGMELYIIFNLRYTFVCILAWL